MDVEQALALCGLNLRIESVRVRSEFEKSRLAHLGLDGAHVNVVAVGHRHDFGGEGNRPFLNHAGLGYCLGKRGESPILITIAGRQRNLHPARAPERGAFPAGRRGRCGHGAQTPNTQLAPLSAASSTSSGFM